MQNSEQSINLACYMLDKHINECHNTVIRVFMTNLRA